jgi:hypothetical protein
MNRRPFSFNVAGSTNRASFFSAVSRNLKQRSRAGFGGFLLEASRPGVA